MIKKLMIFLISIIVVMSAIFAFVSYSSQNDSKNSISETNDGINNQDSSDDSNVLVVYFSMTGNTAAVASEINNQIKGDIIRLESSQEYPDNYDELLDIAREQQDQNMRPEIRTVIENIDQYDTIFIGSPIWWGDMPMIIYSFLEQYDLSDTTIAPFVTHGGSGLSGIDEKIAEMITEANVTTGLAINGNDVVDCKEDVSEWLEQIGF